MRRNTLLTRLALICTMAVGALAVSAPMLPTTAEACGPYGPRTPKDMARNQAHWQHYAHGDDTLWIENSRVRMDGDVAYVRLKLKGQDGKDYRQTMKLHRADGGWALSWAGKVRPRRGQAQA
ncbi:MAG: hypothetical protein AAF799_18240 [Myxococcota bacterium]